MEIQVIVIDVSQRSHKQSGIPSLIRTNPHIFFSRSSESNNVRLARRTDIIETDPYDNQLWLKVACDVP